MNVLKNTQKLLSVVLKSGLAVLAVIIGICSGSVIAEEAGKEVFDNACSACHTGGFRGFMSGAPEIGNNDDWQGKVENGLQQAVKEVLEGSENHESMQKDKNLSEEDVRTALYYIMSKTTVLN